MHGMTVRHQKREWTPLERYSLRLGDLAQRQSKEAALMAAKRAAEQESAIAWRAKVEVEQVNAALRLEVQERIRTQEELERLARQDVLTGLANRRLFSLRLEQGVAHAKRHNAMFSVLFIDLDHFKQINDTLGHHAGDILLAAIAERLSRCARGEDIVARLGGDEFAIIQSEISGPDDARRLAERIIELVCQPVALGEASAFVGASIGIAVFPKDADDAETLQRHADLAMYRAKSDSRNTYRFFDGSVDGKVHRHAVMEREMRAGFHRGEFELHFQPKICAKTERIVGGEALLRWNHADGPVSPAEFIPLAEQCGFITELGEWALREACRNLATWKAAGIAVPIAVNLSAVQLRDQEIVGRIREIVGSYGISPQDIELELTETVVMRDVGNSTRLLGALRDDGFTIAIDDFGTGYSSLSYLGQLPADRLKIDRSFISGLGNKATAAAIVRAVTSLGRSLNLQTVAEGVETEEQLAFLRDVGCDEAQGFLFGRAVPALEFEALLTSRQASGWHKDRQPLPAA